MTIGSTPPRYRISVDPDQCMLCERCITECPYGVFRRNGERIAVNSRQCTACHRCIAMCPRDAIDLEEQPVDYRSHPVWTAGDPGGHLQPGTDRPDHPGRHGQCRRLPGDL